jgi:polyhydroxyalkanoate synthase
MKNKVQKKSPLSAASIKKILGNGTSIDKESVFSWIDEIYATYIGKSTYSLSPSSLALAYCDWVFNLAFSPAKQASSLYKMGENLEKFICYMCDYLSGTNPQTCGAVLPQDKRFKDPAWQTPPFLFLYQSFLLLQEWWHDRADVPGLSKHHKNVVSFGIRQILDMVSPSNFPFLNPVVLQTSFDEKGGNFRRGLEYWFDDMIRWALQQKAAGLEKYKVGENLAITEGKVIYQNDLIELIQYEPKTKSVFAEPVLFIPAWIMKYYILDLSEHNSLVKYLIEKGHTVFMISWKNPQKEDRNKGLRDYVKMGILDSLDIISEIFPESKIHATGYCLGGTILTIAAAYLAKIGDTRLKSVSLLAAQVDFEDAGELMLFVDESQVNFLENMMSTKGYLDKIQLKNTFQMIRSTDLIWSYILNNYMLGKREEMSDLMAWNADDTRLPYRMHSEYLKEIYLNNDLAEGVYNIEGRTIAIKDIKIPLFCVGTEKDHISPWKSVYKMHLLADTDISFVLTAGGHNVGIISEPGHPKARYKFKTTYRGDIYITPERWEKEAPAYTGSWWLSWQQWLEANSSSKKIPAVSVKSRSTKVLREAPGTYIFQQ